MLSISSFSRFGCSKSIHECPIFDLFVQVFRSKGDVIGEQINNEMPKNKTVKGDIITLKHEDKVYHFHPVSCRGITPGC